MALNSASLPPVVKMASSVEYSEPKSQACRSTMALRTSGMPGTTVYFEKLASMAAMAASLMCRGVAKCGSPAPKSTRLSALRAQFSRFGGHGHGRGYFNPANAIGKDFFGSRNCRHTSILSDFLGTAKLVVEQCAGCRRIRRMTTDLARASQVQIR